MSKKAAYAEAGEIRRGERDDDLPDFEVIKAWISRCPATWMPALLRQAVVSSLAKDVAAPDGVRRIVEMAVDDFGRPGGGALRQ